MKNLTVNVPLAVPHQRPPSKYASHPYPYYDCENISVFAAIEGDGYILSSPYDELSLDILLVGDGELRSIHQSLDTGCESVIINDVTISGNGELRSIYQSINAGLDTVIVNNTTISGNGELNRVLINYDNKHDNIKIHVSITGTGTLT